jgi:glycerol-3-phosphate dehydrogenase (NAD(P)+)
MSTRVAVMGSGSWGTAFGMVMADAGCDVAMWGRHAAVAAAITERHENPDYHPGLLLPASMWGSTDAAAVLHDADIVVLAVPAQSLRENLSGWRPLLSPGSLLVSLMKGIELGTTERMSQVIAEVAQVAATRVTVVSGPNLAREIVQRQPAATTVACTDEGNAQRVQEACTTAYFRPYWTTDVVGSEIGGAVKNVIALANGMAVGLGFGENSQASLITRGLAEMTRLGVALGAHPATFLGLAGIGDLIATCQSPLSRNRTFGENLGKGLSFEETVAVTKQTCEGVKSCQPILELAGRAGVEMPITEQVVNVVHHGMAPSRMVAAFMARETKHEQA